MSEFGDGAPQMGQVANGAIGLTTPLDDIDATAWLGPEQSLLASYRNLGAGALIM